MHPRIFYYQGIPRLQLFFPSPNICAEGLLLLLYVLLGCLFFYRRQKQSFFLIIIQFLTCSFVLILEFSIALTYSRGGYLAILLSLLTGIALNSLSQKPGCYFRVKRPDFSCIRHFSSNYIYPCALLSFMTILLCIRHSVDRINIIGVLAKDASILHRFDLWRGAAGMIAKSPFRPFANFKYLYVAWWQPLSYTAYTSSMVNDVLSIGVKFGILCSFIYLFLFFLSMNSGLRLIKTLPNYKETVITIMSIIVSYYISGIFSTMYNHCYLSLPVLVSEIFLITTCFYQQRGKKILRRLGGLMSYPFALSVIISVLIVLLGRLDNKYNYTCNWRVGYMMIGNRSVKFLEATPNSEAKKQVILIRGKSVENPEIDIRCVRLLVRPFLSARYSVIVIPKRADTAVLKMAKKINQSNKHTRLMIANEDLSTLTIVSSGNELWDKAVELEDEEVSSILRQSNIIPIIHHP